MPKKVSSIYLLEQPIAWGKAFFCGMLGAAILMAWIDIFDMMGLSSFNLETYVGTTLRNSTEFMQRAWLVGFIANLVLGGILGVLYSYFFEYQFFRATAKVGALMGLAHALFAGIAILPFFEAVHAQMGLELFPRSLGFLGSNLGILTPLILIVGHVLFGASMGLFYGPVRLDRIRTRNFEPGELGLPGDPDVITEAEDPSDATPGVPYHSPGSAFPRFRNAAEREHYERRKGA